MVNSENTSNEPLLYMFVSVDWKKKSTRFHFGIDDVLFGKQGKYFDYTRKK